MPYKNSKDFLDKIRTLYPEFGYTISGTAITWSYNHTPVCNIVPAYPFRGYPTYCIKTFFHSHNQAYYVWNQMGSIDETVVEETLEKIIPVLHKVIEYSESSQKTNDKEILKNLGFKWDLDNSWCYLIIGNLRITVFLPNIGINKMLAKYRLYINKDSESILNEYFDNLSELINKIVD